VPLSFSPPHERVGDGGHPRYPRQREDFPLESLHTPKAPQREYLFRVSLYPHPSDTGRVAEVSGLYHLVHLYKRKILIRGEFELPHHDILRPPEADSRMTGNGIFAEQTF
jgi:hypothetical protein